MDGASDLPCRELDYKTPLQYAKKPNIDFLATHGKCGMLYPINKKIAPESDQAVISFFGNNVFEVYTGRGVLEAYGSDIDFKDNIVVRCNFAQTDGKYITKVQGANEQEVKELCKKLNKENKLIKLKPTIGYRAVMIIKSNSSPRVTNTHPGYKIIKNYVSSAQRIKGKRHLKLKKCKPLEKDAQKTAKMINEYNEKNKQILGNKVVLVRGVGNVLPNLRKVPGKWALMADMPVEIAIGKLSGMTILPKYQDLERTFKVIKRNWKKYNNFYIQIKGPDKYGHLGQAVEKVRAIEKIDKEFISKIFELNAIIYITADHSTPCKYKSHSKHPTPLLIYGKGMDKVVHFDEQSCQKGSLKYHYGKDLLGL